MSDRAREYVKWLDLPWHLKSFLFLIADYESVEKGCAFPGLATLGELMGKDQRHVRRLLRDPRLAGVIRYEPGCGQGKKGSFRFLDLQKMQIQELLPCDTKEDINGDTKEDTKEDKTRSAIRKNQEPRTRNQKAGNHHSFAALNDVPLDQNQRAALNAAIAVWIGIKETLKAKLSIEEWNFCIRPMFLFRLMTDGLTGAGIVFSIPPSREIHQAARANQAILIEVLQSHGYAGCSFVPYPDDYTLDRCSREFPQFYEQLPEALKKRRPERALA
jgi:hypothetical protein